MNAVDVIPVRELRNNYSAVAKKLEDHDRIIVTNRGKGQAVLISYKDYAKYEEYLRQRYVFEALKEAEEYADRPEAVWLSHDEFWSVA